MTTRASGGALDRPTFEQLARPTLAGMPSSLW